MCTVTFIPVRDTYFITSNRDEKGMRKQALPPEVYFENRNKLIYPKDAEAGGTWIAMNDHGNAAVLLNGAFERHMPSPPYRISRGIIFLEIFNAEMPVRQFMHINLEGIEPFTMIIFCNCLYECRWDGTNKHCRQLRKHRPYIWSSSTLYDKVVVRKREQWFSNFLNKNPHPTQEDIIRFHQFTGDGDIRNDLRINRDGVLSTVSITNVVLEYSKSKMIYLDIKTNMPYQQELRRVPTLEEVDIF